MKGRLALLLISGIVSYPLQASPDFEHYVTGLKQEALAAGICRRRSPPPSPIFT